jgi:hypothetical protein
MLCATLPTERFDRLTHGFGFPRHGHQPPAPMPAAKTTARAIYFEHRSLPRIRRWRLQKLRDRGVWESCGFCQEMQLYARCLAALLARKCFGIGKSGLENATEEVF